MGKVVIMELLSSLLELSEQTGLEPDCIFGFCVLFSVFLVEMIPELLFLIGRLLCCAVRWLRSRKTIK